MTKNELASLLADRTGLTRSQSLHAVEGMMEIMKDSFCNNTDIFLRGFGTFKVVTRKARMARNVSNGTTVSIPEKNVVKFIPCKQLKELVK